MSISYIGSGILGEMEKSKASLNIYCTMFIRFYQECVYLHKTHIKNVIYSTFLIFKK